MPPGQTKLATCDRERWRSACVMSIVDLASMHHHFSPSRHQRPDSPSGAWIASNVRSHGDSCFFDMARSHRERRRTRLCVDLRRANLFGEPAFQNVQHFLVCASLTDKRVKMSPFPPIHRDVSPPRFLVSMMYGSSEANMILSFPRFRS